MSQNSTGPRNQAVGAPSESRRTLISQSGDGEGTTPERVVVSSGPVRWRLVVPDDRTVLFPGCLGYESTDPYAVRITFRVDGYTVGWVFARSLLVAGLLEPAGVGDVEVRPSRRDGVGTVRVTLKAHHMHAALEAPAKTVAAFLRRTCRVVPLGTEHRHLNLDRLVARLVQDVG